MIRLKSSPARNGSKWSKMLLDTCALLWLAHQPEKLSNSLLDRINAEPVIYISSITGFEIGIKYKSGKLELPAPPKTWLETVLKHHDISVIEINLEISIRAAELPPIHKDPCDRFIIATAQLKRLPVVTGDERFAPYGVEVLI